MVKRYTISLPNPDGYEVKPWRPGLFEKPTEIVTGKDYDELKARLAESEHWLRKVVDDHRMAPQARLYLARFTDSAPATRSQQRRVALMKGEPMPEFDGASGSASVGEVKHGEG